MSQILRQGQSATVKLRVRDTDGTPVVAITSRIVMVNPDLTEVEKTLAGGTVIAQTAVGFYKSFFTPAQLGEGRFFHETTYLEDATVVQVFNEIPFTVIAA